MLPTRVEVLFAWLWHFLWPVTAWFQGSLYSDVEYAAGNKLCFSDPAFSYDLCCHDEKNTSCWDGTFTYEACCYTAPLTWYASGSYAEAKMNAHVGPWEEAKCSRSKDNTFLRFSSKLRAAAQVGAYSFSAGGQLQSEVAAAGYAVSAGRANRASCLRAGGRMFNVSLSWVPLSRDMTFSEIQESAYSLCAAGTCNVDDIALAIAPAYFTEQLASEDIVPLLYGVRTETNGPNHAVFRTGTAGQRVPPASLRERIAYRKMFEVCGECDLVRYGNSFDGGYVMCSLENERASHDAIHAGYSYGIAGEDPWSEAVSTVTGVVVHQYDCFNRTQPSCAPPCKLQFHDECLTHLENPWNKKHGLNTLRAHLRANGHLHALDGELLLKVDVEGAEWDVFRQADAADLRKFRQIVVELHYPFLNELTDADRLAKRANAMQQVLRHFYVVHVHPSNFCQPAGLCVEVTFAHRDFVAPKPGGCHRPERHQTDAPSNPELDDVDLATVFAYDRY